MNDNELTPASDEYISSFAHEFAKALDEPMPDWQGLMGRFKEDDITVPTEALPLVIPEQKDTLAPDVNGVGLRGVWYRIKNRQRV